MGQQSRLGTMNPATKARSSGYHQKALEEIRNSLLPFAHAGGGGESSGASTVSSASSNGFDKELTALRQALSHLVSMGYTEDASLKALKFAGGRLEAALDYLSKQQMEPANGITKGSSAGLATMGSKLIRKPSLERGSPALDSGAGSSRSDSPRLAPEHPQLSRQYSPSSFTEPPPPPPPRCSSTPPPPPPPHPASVQHLLKRMSPAPSRPAPTTQSSQTPSTQRGNSPVGSRQQPMVVQNGPQAQQQLTQQMQALNLYPSGGSTEPPPPYPSYTASIQSRQSPTQDYRKSPSSGIYSGSPSPVSSPAPPSVARPTPLQAWGARQAKTQPPIIMQSVKSTQVQKPVLQTAIAPTAPPLPGSAGANSSPPPPSYATSIQQKQQQHHKGGGTVPTPASSPVTVPTTDPPSYASTMQALAAQRGQVLPPPPYGPEPGAQVATVESSVSPRPSASVQRKFSPATSRSESPESPPLPPTTSSSVAVQNGASERRTSAYKVNHQSPIPERKRMSKEKEEERRDCKVRNYSPQAFKFFMEQHIENVIKSYKQRVFRRIQLETEMEKIGLSSDAQTQMRKMLSQKESNYIRLKRAKMDKSMFTKIKPIGVGAFGEVALVRKIDTNHLYAMKTLRKADVLKRNQVAHVKAERDILAEADNEWVVKLYYSFQDKDNLYFVMDYIPGGDLMSLLIKMGIFQEPLARFYIAELVCAVESVHKMGFIHRDIKPDNILIDRDGHIKLTDFGLCTGFRWTHNSKYYQNNGDHGKQDSMDPTEDWNSNSSECNCHKLKPLERRRRREHQRCLAHSLVGTPNYIAPEVLLRTGYTQLCDWWSVGVILYEMLVGSPPFLANTPAETQYKVINWETTLHIPKSANMSAEGMDLILKLCIGADRRLGKNAGEIKTHQFFSRVDFDLGLRRQVAPHIPRIQFSTDTSNFDPVDPERLRDSGGSSGSDEPTDGGKLFHGFFEFTFRRFFDDGGGGPAYPGKISLDDTDNQGGPVYV